MIFHSKHRVVLFCFACSCTNLDAKLPSVGGNLSIGRLCGKQGKAGQHQAKQLLSPKHDCTSDSSKTTKSYQVVIPSPFTVECFSRVNGLTYWTKRTQIKKKKKTMRLSRVSHLLTSAMLVALEPGDLDFQRNLPEVRLVQVPSRRCWDATKQLCGSPLIPVAAEVICVEDEEVAPVAPVAPAHPGVHPHQYEDVKAEDKTLAVPSLEEAAPSLTLGDHQIVEIDPEEICQAEALTKHEELTVPSAQVVAVEETVAAGIEKTEMGFAFDQFGPQARAAFKPPRGREEAPPVAQPVAFTPSGDGSLLGPSARHQFKRPRLLATPARAVSSCNPIGEHSAPKLLQSSAGAEVFLLIPCFAMKCGGYTKPEALCCNFGPKAMGCYGCVCVPSEVSSVQTHEFLLNVTFEEALARGFSFFSPTAFPPKSFPAYPPQIM